MANTPACTQCAAIFRTSNSMSIGVLAFPRLQLRRDLFQLVFGEMTVAHEMLHERLGRSAKDAVDEFAHHLTKHALPRACRPIDVRAIGPAHLEVSLPLENPH